MNNGIYLAMANMMKEVEAIGKDKTNQQQNFKYRGIDQVYNALNPLFAKYDIFTLPKVLNSEREERTNKNGTTLFYSRVTMEYSFCHSDGSYVSCSVIGEGMDSGDKATNKAMAIAHKYALLQTFCIPTEDMPDPDAECHDVKPKQPVQPVQPVQQINAKQWLMSELKKQNIELKSFISFMKWGSKTPEETEKESMKFYKNKALFENQILSYVEWENNNLQQAQGGE